MLGHMRTISNFQSPWNCDPSMVRIKRTQITDNPLTYGHLDGYPGVILSGYLHWDIISCWWFRLWLLLSLYFSRSLFAWTMIRDVPCLRVDIAGASDPGARLSVGNPSSATSVPSSWTNKARPYPSEAPKMDLTYPHISVCRQVTYRITVYISTKSLVSSLKMEIHITSPSVKILHDDLRTSRSLPVFHNNDRVGGQIVLDLTCYQSGRLSVSVSVSTRFFFAYG